MKIFKIHNTLGNKLEEFNPIDPNHVRIYACGPTVYNYAHIGNARPAIVSDLLVRVLRILFPKVTYVANITDIDDKIIKASNETGVSISEITQKYEKIYNEDMKALNVLKPTFEPKATESIPEMIKMIRDLIDNGEVYWVHIIHLDEDKNPATSETIDSWYWNYPHDNIILLADPEAKMKKWIRPSGMPCMILADEKMILKARNLRGIESSIDELYRMLDY